MKEERTLSPPPAKIINFIQTFKHLHNVASEYHKLIKFEMKTPAICKLSSLIQDLGVNRILLTSSISRRKG